MSKHLSLKQARLIKQHRYILRKLATTNVKNRKLILKNAPSQLFQTLNLIFKLSSKNQLNLSEQQTKKIKRHSNTIRKTSKLSSGAIKRKLQNQKGGFLPAILSAALPIIGSLIKAII